MPKSLRERLFGVRKAAERPQRERQQTTGAGQERSTPASDAGTSRRGFLGLVAGAAATVIAAPTAAQVARLAQGLPPDLPTDPDEMRREIRSLVDPRSRRSYHFLNFQQSRARFMEGEPPLQDLAYVNARYAEHEARVGGDIVYLATGPAERIGTTANGNAKLRDLRTGFIINAGEEQVRRSEEKARRGHLTPPDKLPPWNARSNWYGRVPGQVPPEFEGDRRVLKPGSSIFMPGSDDDGED